MGREDAVVEEWENSIKDEGASREKWRERSDEAEREYVVIF